MVKEIIWSPRAAENLEDICGYIAKNSEYYASLVAKRILQIIERIPEYIESEKKRSRLLLSFTAPGY